MKRALITGISGQDGFYLAEYLLSLGYEVHGVLKQTGMEHVKSQLLQGVTASLYERCVLHAVSLDNSAGLCRLISSAPFDECYHLAASSFVGEKLADGLQTIENNIATTHHMLTAIGEFQPNCRFYFAGSSEMFGWPASAPQTEETPMRPRTAYGISKLACYHLARSYRETYGLFCSAGILYNHESPRRRPEFVTRKITLSAARIASGVPTRLELGNLEARRDWGYAPDYVRAMHAMLQHDRPEDFIVATGELHTVREICEIAFAHVGLDWKEHVTVNPQFLRKEDPAQLVGDPKKIEETLGWKRSKSFEALIREMVEGDLVEPRQEVNARP